MALTILEGSTFCICDERGDIGTEDTSGFFTEDTRFLSRLCLRVDGERPLVLSSDKVEYFSAAFFLRNPLSDGLPQDTLAIVRERFVGQGMQDHVAVTNVGMEPVSFELAIDMAADFADIFLVKDRDFALGDPLRARPLPAAVICRPADGGRRFTMADPDTDYAARTEVIVSRPGTVAEGTISYRVELEPRERWEVTIDVLPWPPGWDAPVGHTDRRFGEERARVRDSLAAWQLRVPQLRASWEALQHAFEQSVADLASLRLRGTEDGLGKLPAAGMPWFMTVFGRDTLITCLQTLLFGPELARTALDVLAELQATEDDPSIDAEPGKIVHEVRQGKAARAWFRAYYGSVDATPLYPILLSEVWRWTGDVGLARNFKEPALRALEWIDRWGDRDGDGFVEYSRRSERGLENQSWKDSHDSQRFADGRLARPPIAPCEVQGYVYDAKRRSAELAREIWRDRGLADRLDAEADELRRRFDEAFWVDERGGYYALALDGDKQRVDSLCSNIGHLLWSGIVPEERAEAIADALMGEALWSGWGVRTMSTADRAYNPLSYHNGTVWPHDNSLIAWGLARYGHWPEMQRIAQRMVVAASHFGWQLPEVFSGLRRSETPFPIAYPTAARPQAWAAGTPVLLLQLLLGLTPDPRRELLTSTAPPGELPGWLGRIRLGGLRAFGRQWDVQIEDGAVKIEEA
jgi:glycogen debranching enzyme